MKRSATWRFWFGALMVSSLIPSVAGAQERAATETVVFIRHGEKPELGLGQLDCQGLNRALALPPVIEKAFGKPDFILAPDPSETKPDLGKPYDYVRPLATVEPTAIAFGLPIDASIGVSNLDGLRRKLAAEEYRSALVLVAWEHSDIVEVIRAMMTEFGENPGIVPEWKGRDYDRVDVVKITRTGAASRIAFTQSRQGLDGQSKTCPGPAAK